MMRNIIIYIVGFVLLTIVLVACTTSTKKEESSQDYVIQTSSESQERADAVLSNTGSEDMSHLLKLDVQKPEEIEEHEVYKYYADLKFDWIVTIEPESELFDRHNVSKYITNEWRKSIGYPMLYCLPENDSNWTFFVAQENDAQRFQKLALGWKLYDSVEDPPTVYTENKLADYRKYVKDICPQIKGKIEGSNYTESEASDLSKGLSELVRKNNEWSMIVLKADNKFEGTEIWDVMMSVGLKWGDMDLFHWNNMDLDYGDDQLLSVWTSTNPGYFFPEEIASGNVQTTDLIFGFSIPRSVAPDQVLEVMSKVTGYAQKRLGGQLYDGNGNLFEIEKERIHVNSIVESLKKEDVNTGEGAALYLFQ